MITEKSQENSEKYVPITEDMDPDDLVIYIPPDEEGVKSDHFLLKVLVSMIIIAAIAIFAVFSIAADIFTKISGFLYNDYNHNIEKQLCDHDTGAYASGE